MASSEPGCSRPRRHSGVRPTATMWDPAVLMPTTLEDLVAVFDAIPDRDLGDVFAFLAARHGRETATAMWLETCRRLDAEGPALTG